MRNLAFICAVGGLWEPRDLSARPHIFVDAGLETIFDADATPKAVRISWVYDPLFFMPLVSDMGLDADFDGMLNGDEFARRQGFDMNWIEGYHGDTRAMQSGHALALSGPEQVGV